MDTRDTPEQAELRRAARQLARELGPRTVADLDDTTRAKRLAAAVRDAGWLELRDDAGNGAPLASGVETAIVADALGAAVADVAFSGPILAADLARRAGVAIGDAGAVVGFDGYAVDVDDATNTAFVLDGTALEHATLDAGRHGADLTRALRVVGATSAPVAHLDPDQLTKWTALGLALTSADLVGIMRGVLDLTVAYATERRQYGVPIGSFQAVQHLLAEAHCLMEGSHSIALYASWAVDNLVAAEACEAGRVAKAYCARAARTVCETAVQVHGGIGNTWDCMVHVYLRRAQLSSQWFGDDGVQLQELAHGLS
jgi:alkylation response protein AidB-like acyl-CoA dehydrogenase